MSVVSLSGLAIGLAVTLLIVLYVAHEYSYDRFHAQGERIVKVELNHKHGEEAYTVPFMSYRFGEAVKNACPEVDDFARIKEAHFGSKQVRSDAKHAYFESKFMFADAGFVRLFSFPFLKGDPKTALTRPATVLITESTARKYFGTADPLGKTITYDKTHLFEVVGVLRDLPLNSSIRFDFLAQLDTYRVIEQAMWSFMGEKKAKAQLESVGATGQYDTYLLLNQNTSADRVARKIPSLLTDRTQADSKDDTYVLHPLSDLHFAVFTGGVRGSQQTLTILSVIAALILALALINYVSLTTARSTTRAKEVSVRKIAGAARKALVAQFYVESTLHVMLAFGLAIVLFTVSQPVFYETLNLRIDPSFLSSRYFWLPAAAFFGISILLSGSYPALLLSQANPVQSLKGRFTLAGNAPSVRKALIVFQFTVSIALIAGSITIREQLDLFLNKDLGINRDRIVTVHLDHEDGLAKHYKVIRHEVSQIRRVEAVTASSLLMYDYFMNGSNVKRLDADKTVSLNTFDVDEAFVKTMNLKWRLPPRKGQELTRQRMVINETAAKQLGITAANYEQPLDIGGGMTKNLVGVIKDFNYTTLRQEIRPMALTIANDTIFNNYLYVKLAPNAPIAETIASIQGVYDRYKTDKPFEYRFLDETYRTLYKSEISIGQLIFTFTAFALLIACLGLFGLVTFTAEQRTKEIGIRKVLGASVASIVGLLSKDFLKLVLIAIVIASPIAWYAINQWLRDFAYKITIEWWVFALAGLLAVGIALLTVGFQSIRAALTNPVKSLRSE